MGVKLLVEPVALVEMENAVSSRGIGAESTNLSWNHPLGSYEDDGITKERSRRVQNPTGPSGQILSTQRRKLTAARRENKLTSSEKS